MGEAMTTNHVHDDLGQPIEVAGFRDKPNSIEVHWNAKQEPAWTVKIYFSDDETAVVPAIIEDIHADLRARFLPKPADLKADLEASIETARLNAEGR
mgnify:CR=1 FL=1